MLCADQGASNTDSSETKKTDDNHLGCHLSLYHDCWGAGKGPGTAGYA
jgi:hypothetical protein